MHHGAEHVPGHAWKRICSEGLAKGVTATNNKFADMLNGGWHFFALKHQVLCCLAKGSVAPRPLLQHVQQYIPGLLRKHDRVKDTRSSTSGKSLSAAVLARRPNAVHTVVASRSAAHGSGNTTKQMRNRMN
ncbi:hypothetical protein WJX77_002334 [Trebouxia sp. C0004]